MVRVEILANSLKAAEHLAGLLAFDDGIEVMQTGALGSALHLASPMVDVLVAFRVRHERISVDGPSVVMISEAAGEAVFPTGAVHAVLPVSSTAIEITAAVVSAAAGLYSLTAAQLRHLPRRAEVEDEDFLPQPEKLTARELQVLNLIADGLGNKEIAGLLGITDHTAKFHVAQVLAKLAASTRTEAVRIGIRRGLIAI